MYIRGDISVIFVEMDSRGSIRLFASVGRCLSYTYSFVFNEFIVLRYKLLDYRHDVVHRCDIFDMPMLSDYLGYFTL